MVEDSDRRSMLVSSCSAIGGRSNVGPWSRRSNAERARSEKECVGQISITVGAVVLLALALVARACYSQWSRR